MELLLLGNVLFIDATHDGSGELVDKHAYETAYVVLSCLLCCRWSIFQYQLPVPSRSHNSHKGLWGLGIRWRVHIHAHFGLRVSVWFEMFIPLESFLIDPPVIIFQIDAFVESSFTLAQHQKYFIYPWGKGNVLNGVSEVGCLCFLTLSHVLTCHIHQDPGSTCNWCIIISHSEELFGEKSVNSHGRIIGSHPEI